MSQRPSFSFPSYNNTSSFIADLLHQIGDEDGAMAELKTAVAIYAEIGGQPGSWQPEIWKLTAW